VGGEEMADKDSSQVLMKDTLENVSVLDFLADPISIQDRNFRILYQNHSHKSMTGNNVGKFCYRAVHGRNQPFRRCPLSMCFEDGNSHTFEQTRTTDNRTTYYEITVSPLRNNKDRIVAGIEVVRNISRWKRKHEKLMTEALTDELTGLFNRRGFLTLAEQQRKVANRSKKGMSLLYVDLDGMKAINDKHGHDVGDQALIDTATILKDSFRESDIIARMGGDEFAVLIAKPCEERVEHILVNHIERTLKKYNRKSNQDYDLLLSMGVAHYDPENQCSIDDLIKQADELMYEEKRLHKIGRTLYPLTREEAVEILSFSSVQG
jgi:two-component system cell cycle response regulator